MSSQIPLIPVSPRECTKAAYGLALLLLQVEEEKEAWEEAKKAHKETLTVLNKGIIEHRDIIRRAQVEEDEASEPHQSSITRVTLQAGGESFSTTPEDFRDAVQRITGRERRS